MAITRPNLIAAAVGATVIVGAGYIVVAKPFSKPAAASKSAATASLKSADGPRADADGGKKPGAGAPGAGGAAGGGKGRGPMGVFAANVEKHEFILKIEALGTLAPREKVDLAATLAGRVVGLNFEDGQRVRKGQVLVKMLSDDENAQLQAAQVTQKDAHRNLDRNLRLSKDGAVSQLELQRSQRDADAADAQVQSIQARLRDKVLAAPFDGVLGFRRISLGAFLSPGQVVATLIDDKAMRLEFTVPSIYLSQLRTGVAVDAVTDDVKSRVFHGKITSVDNAIDPVSRAVKVRATLPNNDGALRAGMFMTVTVQAAPRNGLSVPETAIVAEGPLNFVFLIDQSVKPFKAVKTQVELGAREKGLVEIVSGVKLGATVVTDGVLKLRTGMPVRIADPAMMSLDGDSKGHGPGDPGKSSGPGPAAGGPGAGPGHKAQPSELKGDKTIAGGGSGRHGRASSNLMQPADGSGRSEMGR